MKKLTIPCIIAFIICLLLCGCASTDTVDDGKLHVITTVFPQYDFSKNIGGDMVTVEMLLPPGVESHGFEPTPQDMIAISECDLFIYVGGESDEWVRTLLDSMGDSAPRTLTLMECVEPLCQQHTYGMEHREHDHEHEEYDEHVWASPINAMTICNRITEVFCELSPENSEEFNAANAAYQQKLTALDELFEEVVSTAVRKTIVVGDRFPFLYLINAYGIEYFAAFSGCSTESEPSAANIAFLIDKVNADSLPAVFCIEFSNHKVADAIAEATGAEVLLIHSCHNLSTEEIENGCDYISLMTQNAENLRKALN